MSAIYNVARRIWRQKVCEPLERVAYTLGRWLWGFIVTSVQYWQIFFAPGMRLTISRAENKVHPALSVKFLLGGTGKAWRFISLALFLILFFFILFFKAPFRRQQWALLLIAMACCVLVFYLSDCLERILLIYLGPDSIPSTPTQEQFRKFDRIVWLAASSHVEFNQLKNLIGKKDEKCWPRQTWLASETKLRKDSLALCSLAESPSWKDCLYHHTCNARLHAATTVCTSLPGFSRVQEDVWRVARLALRDYFPAKDPGTKEEISSKKKSVNGIVNLYLPQIRLFLVLLACSFALTFWDTLFFHEHYHDYKAENWVTSPKDITYAMIPFHSYLPFILGGLGVAWFIFALLYRKSQHSRLETWEISLASYISDAHGWHLRENEWQADYQLSTLLPKDFMHSVTEFGLSSEKFIHLAEGILLTLYLELIHLIH